MDSGKLYVAEWSEVGLVKVGLTRRSDVSKRMNELRDGCTTCRGLNPRSIRFVGSLDVDEVEWREGAAHDGLAQYHAGGEWFRCTPEQAATAMKRASNASAWQVWLLRVRAWLWTVWRRVEGLVRVGLMVLGLGFLVFLGLNIV